MGSGPLTLLAKADRPLLLASSFVPCMYFNLYEEFSGINIVYHQHQKIGINTFC